MKPIDPSLRARPSGRLASFRARFRAERGISVSLAAGRFGQVPQRAARRLHDAATPISDSVEEREDDENIADAEAKRVMNDMLPEVRIAGETEAYVAGPSKMAAASGRLKVTGISSGMDGEDAFRPLDGVGTTGRRRSHRVDANRFGGVSPARTVAGGHSRALRFGLVRRIRQTNPTASCPSCHVEGSELVSTRTAMTSSFAMAKLGARATHAVQRTVVSVVSSIGGMIGLPATLLMLGCIGLLAVMSLLSWLPGMGATLENCRTSDGDSACSSIGGLAGTLHPKLVLTEDGNAVDVKATGTPSATTYEQWQCTWWAASRRKQIDRPVDGYMGNGWMWRDSSVKHGYPLSKSARPGSILVFQKGVLDADPTYGHVAIVEKVNADGSILISESSAMWGEVRLRTLQHLQLQAHMDDIDFIH